MFTDDPVKNPDAVLYQELSYDEVLEKEPQSDGSCCLPWPATDLPIRVFNMNKPGAAPRDRGEPEDT